MRINKYLAQCGLGSRRSVESIIKEGRVKINKKTVEGLAVEVNEENDTVTVDGKMVKLQTVFTYIMFNKPKGCICTTKDENGRKTVYDYLNISTTIYTVGRLDYDTEGLLIMTNDGDLHFRLTHPKHEIPKTYLVKVVGEVEQDKLATLKKGTTLLDGTKTNSSKIKLKEIEDGNVYCYYVTIYEGKNRQIRKMFESVEKEVVFLKRIAIGDLKLGGLSRGGFRYLSEDEVYYLKNL